MLYHVSSVSGLTILEPRLSTHGKAYVYAVENLTTGLLFGARHDDFDFLISTTEEDIPVIEECYPGTFESVYRNRGCSVYEVSDDGFLRNATGWSTELVCEHDVAVVREFRVDNLYDRLLKEADAGRLVIRRYTGSPEDRQRISNHIVDRLIRFSAVHTTDERILGRYGDIIRELKKLMDGHLLPSHPDPLNK